jgi:ribosomal-protein-alanine N-acetyltransferase
MRFTFTPMSEADAHTIYMWRYDGPYATYNLNSGDGDQEPGAELLAELLDRRSPYYSVRDERGELVGFFNFGTSAQVRDSEEPGIYTDERTVDIGLGMRPDITGKGFGLAFVNAGLDFARQTFAPARFHLYVYTWNERAIRVYERAGFQRERISVVRNIHGEHEFLEMGRDA